MENNENFEEEKKEQKTEEEKPKKKKKEEKPEEEKPKEKVKEEKPEEEKTTQGNAYGKALKKAFSHCLTMKEEGYNPSVVIIGDLEDNNNIEGQVNWETLPKNIKNIQKHIPEIAMMFVLAHPKKLDMVKEKLSPVLGEKKLIIANEENIDKSQRRFLSAIGR